MKRSLVVALVLSFSAFVLTSCGGGKKDETKSDDAYGEYEIPGDEDQKSQPADSAPETTAQTDTAAPAGGGDEAIAEGKALVDANDCKTCHHPTNKIIGPAHTEVAKKYEFTEANVKLLAKKIIDGGSGVWGEIPMSPHPNVSQEDAEKMARYVLSLDGEKEK
ncbi:MAG TPA: c-type cytochrome [Cyclobacteriaceae bacterium]